MRLAESGLGVGEGRTGQNLRKIASCAEYFDEECFFQINLR